MILLLYVTSCLFSMLVLMIRQLMVKIGYIQIDPFKVMQEIQKMIDKEKNETVRQVLLTIVDIAVEKPAMFGFMICALPIFNVLFAISGVKQILNINEEEDI